jgi:hypothetical protein
MRVTSLRWLLAAGLALGTASAQGETLLIQSGQDSSPYAFTPALPRGFRNSAYAFLDSFGGADHSFEYYIQWNLPPALLEPGVEIEYAYAWVYYGYEFDPSIFGGSSDPDAPGEILCHEVLEPWSQSTLTWNDRPAIGTWFDARTEIFSRGIQYCDVTELLRGWIADPGSNHGIALTSQRQRVIGFYTFDDGTVGPNYKPSVLVEYVPEPATGTSLVAGSLLLVALERRRARRRQPGCGVRAARRTR